MNNEIRIDPTPTGVIVRADGISSPVFLGCCETLQIRFYDRAYVVVFEVLTQDDIDTRERTKARKHRLLRLSGITWLQKKLRKKSVKPNREWPDVIE